MHGFYTIVHNAYNQQYTGSELVLLLYNYDLDLCTLPYICITNRVIVITGHSFTKRTTTALPFRHLTLDTSPLDIKGCLLRREAVVHMYNGQMSLHYPMECFLFSGHHFTEDLVNWGRRLVILTSYNQCWILSSVKCHFLVSASRCCKTKIKV